MRVCLRPHAKCIFRVEGGLPQTQEMLLKQARLLGGSIRHRYNSIVVFRVTVFQASQTSSLILRCNDVNVMALLCIRKYTSILHYICDIYNIDVCYGNG